MYFKINEVEQKEPDEVKFIILAITWLKFVSRYKYSGKLFPNHFTHDRKSRYFPLGQHCLNILTIYYS